MPTQNSPLLSFLISWILPVLFFTLIGRLFFNMMNKRGGNMMTFGKANAKVYVQAQTGKTFRTWRDRTRPRRR